MYDFRDQPVVATIVVRRDAGWYTTSVSALAEALRRGGFIELPATRAFVLGRRRWDRRRTFINLRQDGRIRIGGDSPEPAEALLEALARQSEEVWR
jgi:hypothetical protein